MVILDRAQIEGLIDLGAAGAAIEEAYRRASARQVTLPPVGHIMFPGDADCHIKYGHAQGDAHFVIKVATGFPDNAALGLPTGNGLSLVLSAKTGAVEAILHDEMLMTDIRTGIGGAIATRTLARPDSTRVLIVGTGAQAAHQIKSHVSLIGDHLRFAIWGRSADKARAMAQQLDGTCNVDVVDDLEATARASDVIVTTTGATQAVLRDAWVGPGTHITAVGADAPGKQELDVALVVRADVLVADSTPQCLDHGEVSHAYAAGMIKATSVVELGIVLAGQSEGRTENSQITIADLTGIAAQDIAIANVVLAALDRV